MNPKVQEIKNALRGCDTPRQIHECSDAYRDDVRKLYADSKTRAEALHIANLKDYLLNNMRLTK